MKFNFENDWFYKYAADTFNISYDFTQDITSGDSLSSATVIITDSSGTAYTDTMIANKSVTSPDVTFDIVGGTSGETYSILITGTTVDSKIYTHKLTCDVVAGITLNTKLGDMNANSYVTLKEANNYIRNRYGHNNDWDTLSDEGKNRILIQATEDLQIFNYRDERYYDSQNLEFPRSTHDIITGNCATPITNTSFKNTSLYSDTYGKYPTNYWEYGTIHITSGTPLGDSRNISLSNSTTGSITISSNFSATPTTNSQFIVFAPLYDNIKNAQCEQALYIVQNARIDSIQNYREMGVRRIEIGDARMDFQTESPAKLPISGKAKKLLGRHIRRSLRLARS